MLFLFFVRPCNPTISISHPLSLHLSLSPNIPLHLSLSHSLPPIYNLSISVSLFLSLALSRSVCLCVCPIFINFLSFFPPQILFLSFSLFRIATLWEDFFPAPKSSVSASVRAILITSQKELLSDIMTTP